MEIIYPSDLKFLLLYINDEHVLCHIFLGVGKHLGTKIDGKLRYLGIRGQQSSYMGKSFNLNNITGYLRKWPEMLTPQHQVIKLVLLGNGLDK